MKQFWYFFIAKRSFSYLIIVTLTIFGIFSLVVIPKESSPEVRVPVAIVTTVMPGASPEDTERLVTNEIEEQLQGNLPDVRKITSVSGTGVSSIVAEFIAEADLDSSIQDLRDEVAKAVPNLPSDAETPVVSEVNFVDQPIITFAISGQLSERAFTGIADTVENELERIPGISRVSVSGLSEREVKILVRQGALSRFNLSLSDVVQAIRESDAALPIGTVDLNAIEYAVTFEGKLDEPEDLLNVTIVTQSGTPIYLRDIAEIEDGFADAETLSRISINGGASERALSFDVFKRQGGDITELTSHVREQLAAMQKSGGALEGLEVLVIFDTGEYLVRDLVNLMTSGAFSMLLVIGLLFLSLGWREALVAGSAIPLSFLVAFIGLEYSGNTINFISLFSLILVIGILVDAAIVVVEGIHANMRKWMDKEEAARTAITQFQWPLISGTFTTIAVFAPLFLISGVTGQFIANIPFTVITVLLAALFVALGIVPVIASVVLRRRMTSNLEEQQEKYAEQIKKWYRSKLERILDTPYLQKRVLWGSLATFVIAIALPIVGLISVEFFPQEDSDFIFVDVEHPQGTALETSDITMRRVEEHLYSHPDIDSFVTTIGQSNAFSGNTSRSENLANVFVILKRNRGDTSTQIVEDLRKRVLGIREAEVRVSQLSGGPPVGDPVVITITGSDFADLERTALSAEQLLRSIEGTVDVQSSLEESGTQFEITIDRPRAAQLGVSPLRVAQTLRTAVFGTEAATLKTSGDDIAVVVKLGLEDTAGADPIAAIRQISIPTPQGSVLLGSLIETQVGRGSTAIRHEDGNRIATISSGVSEGVSAFTVLSEFSTRAEEELSLPIGTFYSTGGENEDAQQAFEDMFRALIIGFVLMLAILVIQFNSFRYGLYVLSIVPLSLVGVFFGLLITREALSFPSMMGFIALAGIVVNNSIILIDVMNSLRKGGSGMSVREVVLEGATSRLRPIMLTAITTIVGVAPLIFVSELWGPLAYAIMFGLMFSVLITLVLIPTIYYRWPGKVGKSGENN